MRVPYIPYFTTSRYRVETMIELAQPQKGEKGIDLGSGDGRIVIAFAKCGVEMLGLELDPELVLKSQTLLLKERVSHARIEDKDIWQIDLSSFDIITIYPMPDVMANLEAKIKKEAKKGARIVTNYYPLPTLQAEAVKDHIYLYRV